MGQETRANHDKDLNLNFLISEITYILMAQLEIILSNLIFKSQFSYSINLNLAIRI
jgi:hypothetical protein